MEKIDVHLGACAHHIAACTQHIFADKINTLGMGVKIGTTSISILMYADDIVLLSETENGLQMMLNELYTWCNKWRMKLTLKRVKRKIKTKQEFYFGPNVDYKYLG